jgi:hypothetical protein
MFPEYAPLIRTKVDQWGNRTVCSGDEKLEVIQWIDDTAVGAVPPRPRRPGAGPLRRADQEVPGAGGRAAQHVRRADRQLRPAGVGAAGPAPHGAAVDWRPASRRSAPRWRCRATSPSWPSAGLGDRDGVPGEGPPRLHRGAELRVRAVADAGAGAAPRRPLPRGPGDRHGRKRDHRPGRARVDGLVRRADRQRAGDHRQLPGPHPGVLLRDRRQGLAEHAQADHRPGQRRALRPQYTPAKDIGDTYTVDVSYGFAAGLSARTPLSSCCYSSVATA